MAALLCRLSQELPWRQCYCAGHNFKHTRAHRDSIVCSLCNGIWVACTFECCLAIGVIPLPRVGMTLPGINDCDNKNCLCSNKIEIDYKNARFLSQFTSPVTGNIFPRTLTRVCRVAQWKVAKSIKKARCAGLMPIVGRDPRYARDPPLFY